MRLVKIARDCEVHSDINVDKRAYGCCWKMSKESHLRHLRSNYVHEQRRELDNVLDVRNVCACEIVAIVFLVCESGAQEHMNSQRY